MLTILILTFLIIYLSIGILIAKIAKKYDKALSDADKIWIVLLWPIGVLLAVAFFISELILNLVGD